MTEPVQLQVWSDFLCPWCYVGAIRMADLEAEYGDRIEVTWKSYLLQPEVKPKTLDGFRSYTRRWNHEAGPGAVEARARFHEWGDATPPSHSVPAAIAGKVAATFGTDAFDRFHLALMRAYFTQNRTISDRDVIVAVAQECGLDRAEFEHRLVTRGGEFHQVVFADMAEGIELGVHAAPTVLFNRVLPIPGAQELDTYRSMIDRVLARNATP